MWRFFFCNFVRKAFWNLLALQHFWCGSGVARTRVKSTQRSLECAAEIGTKQEYLKHSCDIKDYMLSALRIQWNLKIRIYVRIAGCKKHINSNRCYTMWILDRKTMPYESEGDGEQCACKNPSPVECGNFHHPVPSEGGCRCSQEVWRARFQVIQSGFIEWKFQRHFCIFQSLSSDLHWFKFNLIGNVLIARWRKHFLSLKRDAGRWMRMSGIKISLGM